MPEDIGQKKGEIAGRVYAVAIVSPINISFEIYYQYSIGNPEKNQIIPEI
jgi:hypothetical protein